MSRLQSARLQFSSYSLFLKGSQIYPKKNIIWKDMCIPMFIAALFTTAKTRKQPKCPSTEKWIKICYIHTMEYYSAIKKEWNNAIYRNMDGSEDYHTKWSKTKERQISYNIAYKWNLKKGTNELIYKIERESQTKKTNLWLPKERQEKDKLGVWY